MVTCRELIEFLDDYVAETLPAGVRSQFELHMKLCGPCRRYLETYRRTIDLERRALANVKPEDCDEMPEELVHAIVAAMKSQPTDTQERP